MNQKYRALFGLKWNPFSPNVPAEALWRSPQIEHFCWRIDELVREGFERLLGCEIDDTRWRIAKLPPRFGGFGLRTGKDRAGAQYLCSITRSVPVCRQLGMELDWRRLIEVECAPWLMRAYASKGCDPTELVRKIIDREKKRSRSSWTAVRRRCSSTAWSAPCATSTEGTSRSCRAVWRMRFAERRTRFIRTRSSR